jgi:hypothetical protein
MSTEPGNFQSLLSALLIEGLEGLTTETTEVVWGVTDRAIHGNRSQAISEIRQILVESERVFLFDGNVVFEKRYQVDGRMLIPLMHGDQLTRAAPSHLAELFYCAVQRKNDRVTYQPPAKVLTEVLNGEATRDQLPRIAWYSRRPVFDHNFQLCEPGYSASEQILVHADPVAPVLWEPQTGVPPLDRLPPGLHNLLQDFCFDTGADLVNVVALLLTGVLMNHVVEAGKPVAIVNGNQRGVGKSLLALVLGIILDGVVPPLVHHSNDEDELAKRLGAKIKLGRPYSVLFFDNRKGCIGGPLLESLVLAERVSVRQLGLNEDISRNNDFLWVFTANNAKVTTDMTSRAVFIQLHYEGDPRQRFAGTTTEEESLKRYACEHRGQILGELLGMVIRWRDAGRPLGTRSHRCKRWAELVGGILQVASLPEYLSNQHALLTEADEDLTELAVLAEHVIGKKKPGFFTESSLLASPNGIGKKALDWVPILRDAKLRQNELALATSERSVAIFLGCYFGARLGKPVPVQVNERTGTATLKAQPGRSRSRRYWLEVQWDLPPVDPSGVTISPPTPVLPPPPPMPTSVVVAPPTPTSVVVAPPTPTSAASPPTPTPPPAAGTGGNDLIW